MPEEERASEGSERDLQYAKTAVSHGSTLINLGTSLNLHPAILAPIKISQEIRGVRAGWDQLPALLAQIVPRNARAFLGGRRPAAMTDKRSPFTLAGVRCEHRR